MRRDPTRMALDRRLLRRVVNAEPTRLERPKPNQLGRVVGALVWLTAGIALHALTRGW